MPTVRQRDVPPGGWLKLLALADPTPRPAVVTRPTASGRPATRESEAQFTRRVIGFAQSRGWKIAHFRSARTSKAYRSACDGDAAGFPGPGDDPRRETVRRGTEGRQEQADQETDRVARPRRPDRADSTPFKFTGKIEKITLTITPPKPTPEDIKRLQEAGKEKAGRD